jgi:hypothetical protein
MTLIAENSRYHAIHSQSGAMHHFTGNIDIGARVS